MVYYGLAYGVADLPGNLYINNTISGAVDLCAYILCIIFMDIIGRKWMTSGFMIFGGMSCLGAMLLNEYGPNDDTNWMYEFSKWLAFCGKFAISGSFSVLYIFAAELFPTEVRTIGLAFMTCIGCIGGAIVPFIIILQDDDQLSYVPFLIFGILGILSGLSVFSLPETTGKPILQTIDEAEYFYAQSGSRSNREDTTLE